MKHYKNMSLEDIDGEIWANVNGFDGIYMVSTLGRIKSLERISKSTNKEKIENRIIKQTENTYLSVNLTNGSYRRFNPVHISVATAFIANPENKPQVNHKDGDKWNNVVDNLEWATAKENAQHSYHVLGNKGSLNGVFGERHPTSRKVYCETTGITYGSIREAARSLNVNHGRISGVCLGIEKSVNGLTFKYASAPKKTIKTLFTNKDCDLDYERDNSRKPC